VRLQEPFSALWGAHGIVRISRRRVRTPHAHRQAFRLDLELPRCALYAHLRINGFGIGNKKALLPGLS
jgi:hypothetical protein